MGFQEFIQQFGQWIIGGFLAIGAAIALWQGKWMRVGGCLGAIAVLATLLNLDQGTWDTLAEGGNNLLTTVWTKVSDWNGDGFSG